MLWWVVCIEIAGMLMALYGLWIAGPGCGTLSSVIPRKQTEVDIQDRSTELPDDLPAGTHVRLTPSRATGVVVRAEQDAGGLYVVLRLDSTGGERCVRPDRLVPINRSRRSSKASSSTRVR